jgi:formylglycine-generating enzyme required for sulfatase activity
MQNGPVSLFLLLPSPSMNSAILQTRSLTLDGVEFTFCRIPACTDGFLMGDQLGNGYLDEQPVHRVVIPQPFWMLQTPVTQSQFLLWTKTHEYQRDFKQPHRNSHLSSTGEILPDHPAEDVTWRQANGYCQWLTERLHEQPSCPDGMKLVRLPYEAEWEYACRGGTGTEYWNGDGVSALAQIGWFDSNSNQETQIVGATGKSNPFGLHDMHGNVWEWCQDRWHAEAYRWRWDGITAEETFDLNEQMGDKNESKSEWGEYRVRRGGSFFNTARNCRAAFRNRFWAGLSNWDYGLRVCLVP